jgi:hypothetical protein
MSVTSMRQSVKERMKRGEFRIEIARCDKEDGGKRSSVRSSLKAQTEEVQEIETLLDKLIPVSRAFNRSAATY